MRIYKKLLMIIMLMFSIFALSINWNNNIVIASASYYNSINDSLEKDELKLALRTLITSTHKYQTTYDDCKNPKYVSKTDGDPNNPGNIILFWSGLSISSAWDSGVSWNREHVWPKSNSWFYTSLAGSDLHHIRPTDPNVNSVHSNNIYGEIDGSLIKTSSKNGSVTTDCENDGSCFEPAENRKGDTARIIFYLLTRYSEADAYMDGNRSNGEVTQVVQNFDLLLQWNNQDPVDESETRRNDAVQSIQGNRNPFIDNSDYANIIWGDGSTGGGNTSGGNTSGGSGDTEKESVYKLVNSTSELSLGDKIIIASKADSMALSIKQNTNNRGQASVSINENSIIPSASVQLLTLENGNKAGTYALNTGDGYLCSAASDGNYLRTETSLTDNSSWSINVSNSVATIISQGEYTRNRIRYNLDYSLFSCYGSTNNQKDVNIFKLDSDDDVVIENPYSDFENLKTKSSIILDYKEERLSDDYNITYTFAAKVFDKSGETKDLNGISWTNVNNGGYHGYDATKGQQFGKAAAPATKFTLTSEKLNNVKSISVTTCGASSISAKLTVTVNGVQIGNIATLNSYNTTYKFTCDEALDGEIVLSYSQTSSKAIYIKEISVSGEEEASYEMVSGGIRFGTCITKELFDKYNSENTVWGVEYYIGAVNSWDAIEAKQVVCSPARVAYEGSNVIDENGSYYQFALVFTGIDYSKIDTVISARVYVTIDGETHYMQSTTYSFRDVATKYLSLEDTSSFKEHLGILNYISSYQE